QMLGDRLVDRDGIEAAPGTAVAGLGLLPVTTTFAEAKATRRVSGVMRAAPGAWGTSAGEPVRGYEIHMGQTEGEGESLVDLDGRADGCVSTDGRVAGTYLHGLLHNDGLRRALLAALGRPSDAAPAPDTEAAREAAFDRLASTVRDTVDIPRI